jgi:DNA-binding CsgD family transcriptional regulator/tetratricopeptide (TPR) repeat protein
MEGSLPHVSPVLVGRDDLLQLADRRIEAARDCHGDLVLLAGEAGIGKTRLLGAIERRAVAGGFQLARGSTFRGDLEVAAAPFLDLARMMARTDPFRSLGAQLEQRLLQEDRLGGDASRRRRLLVLDVVDLLASMGRVPTLLALENMSFADDLSLEIVDGLARRIVDLPMLVVATYRSDELYPRVPMRTWRARLLNDRLAEEANLGRLTLEETATMATLILASGLPAPRDLVEAIHARSDGIPLHVEEFLSVVAGEDRPDRETVRAADVPDTLEEAIIERLDRRSARAQRLARTAAVIGHAFDVELVADLAGVKSEAAEAGLDELVAHFFLAHTDAADQYDFRHALIRDAVYAQLPSRERRRLHGRVADLAVDRGGEAPAFLSIHYEQAGRRDDAYLAALAGARAEAAISSHRESFELYQRAMRNAPTDLPPLDRARALHELADEAAATDDNASAVTAYVEAREQYRAAGAIRQAAALAADEVAVLHLIGEEVDSRIAILQEALAELEGLPADPETQRVRARLEAMLGATYHYDLRWEDALRHLEEGRRLAIATGDEATELHAMASIASAYTLMGRLTEAWVLFGEQIRRAREARLEAEAARGYRLLGASASEVVEYERAEAAMRDGIEYGERVERWNDRHYMAAHLGLALWATGRWDEATTVAEHALADGRGGVTTRITALYVLGYVAAGRGDWPRARETLEESLRLGERINELLRTSLPRWGLAEAALLSGDPALAVAICERARADSERVGDSALLFPFLVTGTRAQLALADPVAAQRWLETVESALRRRVIPGALAAIDHARGLLLMADGSTGQARSALESARRGWDQFNRVWEGTWARLDLGACLLRSSRPAEAMVMLDDVRSVAGRLRSRPLLGRADELLRTSRNRHAPDERWHPLTVREFEVARLIAAGQTNAGIAESLGIAPKTASAHVEHILAKLGAVRRTEIAAWASAISRLEGGGAP